MNNEHPISDEVLDMANIALSKGERWMTYNHVNCWKKIPHTVESLAF